MNLLVALAGDGHHVVRAGRSGVSGNLNHIITIYKFENTKKIKTTSIF